MALMISAENPFGLRPDELAGAIRGGYLGSVKSPTVAEVERAIEQYDKSSSVKYSSQEKKNYVNLAKSLNSSTKNSAKVPAQEVSVMNSTLALLQSPAQQISGDLFKGASQIDIPSVIMILTGLFFLKTVVGIFRS